MPERPDLERLPAIIRLYKAAGGPGELEMLQDFEAVVAYCRELEAENKRLQTTVEALGKRRSWAV